MDPSFGWDYAGPVVTGLRGDTREAIVSQLYALAQDASDPLVWIGAYGLLAEAGDLADDQRFVSLLDGTLDYMQAQGYSSGHLTRDEADRWIVRHGDLRGTFDGIVEVGVPASPADLPDLAIGENLLLATTGPMPEGNAFFAERGADGTYVVFSERIRSTDDHSRARYDESYLGTFDGMHELCIAVGNMFGTRPYWALDLLVPYFPTQRGDA